MDSAQGGGGGGLVIMKRNLAKELASVEQDLLFLVFLDIQKLYDNLDHERLLNTLEGYGVGPKIRDILEEFWYRNKVVNRQN